MRQDSYRINSEFSERLIEDVYMEKYVRLSKVIASWFPHLRPKCDQHSFRYLKCL